MGGYKRTGHTVYVVVWDDVNLVKVGYSERQRWRSFVLRGARLLDLRSFDQVEDAFAHEWSMKRQMAGLYPRAFPSRIEAQRYLGVGGGGWSECYRAPPDEVENMLRVMRHACATHARCNARASPS